MGCLLKIEHALHDTVVALIGDMLAVVLEPAFVAFADDEDDMRTLGILPVGSHRGLHGFRAVEDDFHVKLRIGDVVPHVLAHLFHRFIVGVLESEHEMVDTVLRGLDDF